MLLLANKKSLRISKYIQHYFTSSSEQIISNTPTLRKPSNANEILQYISSQSKHFTIDSKDLKSQRQWMKECIPILKRNTDEIIKQQLIGDLFLFYQRIKMSWNDLINIGHKCLIEKNLINTISLTQLIQVYVTLVELKYEKDPNFVGIVRSAIQQKIISLKNIQDENVFNCLKYLQMLILDKNVQKQEKNNLISRVAQKATTNPQFLKNIQKIKETKISLLSSLHEQIKVYEIVVHESLRKIFENANNDIDAYIKKNSSESKSLKKMSSFLKQDKAKQKIFYQSTFQIMFEKKLRETGYNYDPCHVIKGNQYDFLITSKTKHKFYPLQNLDLNMSLDEISKQNKKNWKPFSITLLNQLSQSEQQYINKVVNLPQNVIVNLNGPHHYIDSDILPKYSICRKQQFKYQKLRLYGIYRYNSVNFDEWQKASKYEQLSQLFIEKIIKQAKILKRPNL